MKKTIVAILLAACGFISLADNVVYVSPSGNDANSGSEVSPFKTINKAVLTLNALPDIATEGGTVYLADGTYDDETPIFTTVNIISNTAVVVTNPISIEGMSKDPTKVIVQRTAAYGRFRLFYLNHVDAAVKYLTVTGGWNDSGKPGGGIYIGSAGGLVSDCIVESCKNGGNNANGGAGISMENGRVLRTIVRNCNADNMRNYGHGIYASGGVIDNCLVTGCRSDHHVSSCNGNAAVYLTGTAKMVNSTVTKNTSCLVSGVWIASDNAQAVNCAVYGNLLCSSSHNDGMTKFIGCFACKDHSTSVTPAHNAGLGDIYLNCASESEPYTESCIKLTESPFVDFDGSDYTHDVYSPLANTGDSTLARAISQSDVDLYGNERYSGTRVDIGAYELPQGFSVGFTADKTTIVLPSDNTVTFTADASGASGEVTYTWNFGDGSSLETVENVVEHEYTVPGHHEVRLTATDGSHYAEYVLQKTIDVYEISFSPGVVNNTSVVTNLPARFIVTDVSTEETITYTWDFGDGLSLVTTSTEVEHSYSSLGSYNVSVRGETATGKEFALEDFVTVTAISRDLYADASSTNPKAPYDSWATAANSLRAVVGFAADGCVIHVKPGTYTVDKAQTVVVNKAVTIVGEGETPADVIIPGNANDSGNRNMTVRAEGALVCNMTLYGGFAGQNSYGGANLYLTAGTVSNCVLSSGRAHNNNSEAGGAKVLGGLLTHCVITNSWNRNRGNGIVLVQSGGRVSNCLITSNWKSFDVSRNSSSLVYVSGGVMDNCTIANCWIMYNTGEGKYQTTDKAFNVTGSGKAYNCAIADINYVGYSAELDKVVDYTEKTPQRWAGTAASFVNCATDDATAINETCFVGTLEKGSLFEDYANRNLMAGLAVKNKGAAIDGYAIPSVDLAGKPRIHGSSIDIGCFERQAMFGMSVMLR